MNRKNEFMKKVSKNLTFPEQKVEEKKVTFDSKTYVESPVKRTKPYSLVQSKRR